MSRTGGILKRRRLLTSVAALSAALVAKMSTSGRAEAANGGNMILGQTNTATNPTNLIGTTSSTAFFVDATGGKNVWCTNNGGGGPIILAQATIAAPATSPVAIQGESPRGPAIVGSSNSNTGVYGQGAVYGLWGQALANGVGVYGAGASATGLGGLFDGGVVVNGPFTHNGASTHNGNMTVNGAFSATGIKSAIVPNKAGQLVHLYSIEAPDSYFEDVGTGATGANGEVQVPIPADFREVVRTDAYLVFLTAYGPSSGLHVASQNDSSFVVAGGANVRFAWRVLARRADVEAPRFMPAGPISNNSGPARISRPDIVSPGENERPDRGPDRGR